MWTVDAAAAEIEKLKPEYEELVNKGIECKPDKLGHKLRLLGKNYKRACELEKRINLLGELQANAEKEQEILTYEDDYYPFPDDS